jgi:DNA-directed RNA polymerase specialized sigma24 family protein
MSNSASAAQFMIRQTRWGGCCSTCWRWWAEFESDLIRLRTREGMQVAKAKGRLRGKQSKLKPNQAKHLLELHDSGNYTQAELAELFGLWRSTIYRTIDRIRPKPIEPERPFAHFVPPSPNLQISAPQKSQPTE